MKQLTLTYKKCFSGWEAVNTNIKDINIGDTVFHNGHAITISKSNFKTGGFMGTTIDGDSYKNGSQPVIKLTHNRGLKRFNEAVDPNLQKMLSSGWEAVDTNIKDIRVGDTVFHNGHAITISKSNFKTGGFMGTTIDGDSYKNGTQPVIKLTHNRGLKK